MEENEEGSAGGKHLSGIPKQEQ